MSELEGPPTPRPPAPVNRFHEWGAAVAIMILLGLIVYLFVAMLKGLRY